MKRSVAFVFSFAACWLVACGGLPGPLTARSLKVPTIPPAVTPADASMFGYLRIREPVELARRLGFGEKYDQMKARLPLDELTGDKTAAIFAWDPGAGGFAAPPSAAVLPLSATSALVLGVTQTMSKPARDVQGGVLIELTPPGGDKAQSELGDLLKLAGLPIPSNGQLELVLKFAPLRARYGAFMDIAMAQMEATRKAQSGKGMNAQSMQLLKDWWATALEARIVLRATADFLDIDIITHNQAPAAVDPVLGPSTDLASYLPPGTLRAEFDGSRSGRWLAQATLSAFSMLEQQSPLVAERLAKLTDQLRESSMGVRYASSSTFEKGHTFSSASIVYGQDLTRYRQILADSYALFKEPAIIAALKEKNIEITIDLQRGVRTYRGLPVDRYVTKSVLPPTAFPEVDAETLAKLRDQTIEIIRVGNYMVSVANGTPATLNKLVDGLYAKKPQGTPLRAVKDFPFAGTMHLDMDVAALWEWVRSLKADLQAKLPSLGTEAQVITMFAYSEGGAGNYRIRVPQSFVHVLHTLAK